MGEGGPVPTQIKLHQKSRVMEIAFADGRSFRPLYYLGENQERLWAEYLEKLKKAGAGRE